MAPSFALLVTAVILSVSTGLAQEKGKAAGVVTTTLIENDKVLVLENRFAPGVENANETLDVTERTLQRDWKKAKILLRAILRPV